MLKNFSLDKNNFVIDSEEKLLDIFGALIDKGLDLNIAYNFIVENYGEEVISKFFVSDNFIMEIPNVIK